MCIKVPTFNEFGERDAIQPQPRHQCDDDSLSLIQWAMFLFCEEQFCMGTCVDCDGVNENVFSRKY